MTAITPTRLRRMRELSAATLDDAARIIDATPATLSRWESGVHAPSDAGDVERLIRFYRARLEHNVEQFQRVECAGAAR